MNVAKIGSKAGNFLCGKRGGGGGERERDWDRKIEGRDIKIEKKRDRANNKNPQQSRVAQLVNYKYLQAVGE